LLAVPVVLALPALAAEFPSRTIRLIVGPSPDAITRIFADQMHKHWGQPVIVEPHPGAGGDIAAKAVTTAEPDGYTLLNATSSFPLNVAMHTATYDFVKDFEPIAMINASSFVLIVNKSLPVKSLKDLIALAKAKPGVLNCGSAGQGTPPHLACELFNKLAGVDTVHVPFREANASINSLLGDHIQFTFAVSAVARGQIQGNAVRALAVTTAEPSKLFPGIPTMAQAGLKGFEITGWGSFMAPAGTPRPIIDKLNAEIVREGQDKEVRALLANMGLDPPPAYSPAQFADFIKGNIAHWNQIIDTAGIARGRHP
jgi:tripartite-type tricarboxylate transporter receptor subunit TctC